MNKKNCDEILMAAMALADGEETGAAPGEIEEHAAGCEGCRGEMERFGAFAGLLKGYERRGQSADLWPQIERRIAPITRPAAWSNWQIFAGLAFVLAAYKLIEMVPVSNPGHLLKIAPVLAAAALFIFLKENPFKINTELIPEK